MVIRFFDDHQTMQNLVTFANPIATQRVIYIPLNVLKDLFTCFIINKSSQYKMDYTSMKVLNLLLMSVVSFQLWLPKAQVQSLCNNSQLILTHFLPMLHFYTP